MLQVKSYYTAEDAAQTRRETEQKSFAFTCIEVRKQACYYIHTSSNEEKNKQANHDDHESKPQRKGVEDSPLTLTTSR